MVRSELLIHNEPTGIISGGFYQRCWEGGDSLGGDSQLQKEDAGPWVTFWPLLWKAVVLSHTKSSREKRALVASPELLDPAVPEVYAGPFSFMSQ